MNATTNPTESIYSRALFALAGHSKTGLRLRQVAEAVGESDSTTLRNLQRMEIDGLVEQNPLAQGHWRLAPRVVQIAIAHSNEVAREERALSDFKNRYSRTPD
jgi:DNA-binding IclR family transcriptional regulator